MFVPGSETPERKNGFIVFRVCFPGKETEKRLANMQACDDYCNLKTITN